MLRSSLENQMKSWSKIEHYTLEFNYLSTINDIIDFYNEDYSKLVDKYREKTDRSVFSISHEYIDSNPDLINNNISLLRNAIELGRTSITVGDSISPILLHYSFHCLMSFLNYTLFHWSPKHAKGHGLYTYIPPDNIPSNIILRLHPSGVFKRFIDVFTLLGCPIAFSQVIPIARKNKVEFIKNRVLIQNDQGKIQFKDIFNFEPRTWKDKLKLNDEENIESTFSGADGHLNNFLISYSVIFVVSNIARYRPALWNQILLGKDEFNIKIIQNYKGAIRHYASFITIVDNILSRIKWMMFRIRINGTLQDDPINFI